METWEPQIRTNLEHPVYGDYLDGVLRRTPGLRGAALINTRFREGCYRMPDGEAPPEEEVGKLIALTDGLFGVGPIVDEEAFAEAIAEIGDAEFAYLSFREEAILIQKLGDSGRTLAITVSSRLNLGACSTLIDVATRQVLDKTGDKLTAVLEKHNDVLAGVLVENESGEILDRYGRYGEPSQVVLDGEFGASIKALVKPEGAPLRLALRYRNGESIEIRSAEIATERESLYWSRVPFDPEHLVILRADRRAVRALLWLALRNIRTETLRMWVDGLLEYGVPSTMEPFPETQAEFLAIVNELGQLHENDLLSRLDLGGFANYTVGEGEGMQRCQECIYYLPNGRWCDLPELPVPVEPHWWCRLWKM